MSCNILTTENVSGSSDKCQQFFSSSRVFVSGARFPNNLGGKGGCGSSGDVSVVNS